MRLSAGKKCEDILFNASDGKVQLYTSTFTITEVIRPRKRDLANARRLSRKEEMKIRGMFQWPWLRKIDLDQRVALEASKLAIDCGLSPADSIQAASAIIHKVDELQNWDRRHFSKIGHLVQVCEPDFISEQRALIENLRPPIGPTP